MPTWATSLLLSIATSAATTMVLSLTIGPRLAARGKRIQAAYDDRDRFNNAVLDILALCSNLETATNEPGNTPLQTERGRWASQIDDATRWLSDHWQHIALRYSARLAIRQLTARYIGAARGLWLSNRPLQERVRKLKEITEPVHTIYFAPRWRVLTTIRSEVKRLHHLLNNLEKSSPPPKSAHTEPQAPATNDNTRRAAPCTDYPDAAQY